MAKKSEISDSTKNIITLLLLLFVYPVGIIVMWLWTKWKKWVKILVTAPLVLVIFVPFMIGLFATVNVNGSIQKGKCAKQCENSSVKETCMTQCLNIYTTPSTNYSP